MPATDRWHRKPTPLLGGVSIAGGTIAAVVAFASWDRSVSLMVGAGLAALVLGLVDDRVSLGPTAKLVGSLAIGAAVVYVCSSAAGVAASPAAILLAVVWFAGVVHAFNLLDNMDGLAAGVGAISAVTTALVLVDADHGGAVAVLAALAGALTGFLPWNSHPARMFMGDGGSLFIGAILSAASLISWLGPSGKPSMSSLAILIPFIVPVSEVVFVSSLRWLAGRNPARGGIDHPSHRLVAMGLSERRAVLFLYAITAVCAGAGLWVATSGGTALPFAAVLVVGVALGAVYLARVPTYQGEDFTALQRVPYGHVLRTAFLRSHAVQVLLDLVLIAVCYYAAYRLRFEGEALDIFLPSFAASLPIVLVCKPVAHYAAGLYGRSWASFGVGDIPAVIRAVALGSTTSVLAATYLYRFERFSRGVFVIDAALLLLAILGSRLSFRIMAHAAVLQSVRARRVLICGTGERGRLLAREMLANAAWHMKPVGFVAAAAIDEHSLLGVRVAGTFDDLPAVIRRLRVDEVVFSGDNADAPQWPRALGICREAGVSARELVFEIRAPSVTSDSRVI
jgi:UDP-GlcNAc:undecaprenyl-phosphate GlcNAc-1-phosphate transferase